MLTKTTKKPAQQSTLVNQAHRPFFQRQALLTPATPSLTMHAPGLANGGFYFGHIPVLQPKLSIGQPNNQYEQEADRVADQVMRMPDSVASVTGRPQGMLQRTCASCANEYAGAARQERSVQEANLCPKCRVQAKPLIRQMPPLLQREMGTTPEEDEEDKTHLQTKLWLQTKLNRHEKPIQAGAAPGNTPAVTSGVASGINAMQGRGQTLSPATRGFMETRFGRDFSQVRVHTDTNAVKIARQINARAFTVGQDIAFASGQYQPHTPSGKRLLAHELTHTIQQTGTIQRQGGKSPKPKPKNVYEDCTTSQKAAIGTAFTNALGYVNTAVNALNTAYSSHPKISARVKSMLQQHFHTTKKKDIGKILSKFRDIQNAMSRGINFECETDCDAGTGGYVWKFLFWSVGDVHICFNLFNKISQLQREETVIHEIAHRHAGVGDKAYHWQAKYKSLSAKKAMDNADSYAVFARRL